MKTENIEEAIILFAGDSGDGMQLTGNQFSQTSALEGNDISTFPDFPAEIRAPQGTLSGVSGFQLHFSRQNIYSAGDECDVLVAMNAAAYQKNIDKLKKNGILIANTSGFDNKNLRLAQLEENPLDVSHSDYKLYAIDLTKNTLEALSEVDLSRKNKERSKNMYALGFVYWLYNKDLSYTLNYLSQKFGGESTLYKANEIALKEGYKFGEITDVFTERYQVEKAEFPKGLYRNISGNGAIVLGLLAASVKAQRSLFFAGYPITPASDILQYLSRYKSYGAKTFQAEDEIAAISSAIGASFAGNIGVTASSGPGLALKTEAIGLAVMLEIPLVIINVQRGGPSTGLPTKTEQADLMQALFSRNGEAPLPVLAAQSPADCFRTTFMAAKMALEHNTPVILLSDGYIANGSEPWKIESMEDLDSITIPMAKNAETYLPYQRDKNGVRQIAYPGTPNFEHVIGGLEKKADTGEVSYQPENHQKMVKSRLDKVRKLADFYAPIRLEHQSKDKKLIIVTWGSTYGSAKSAMKTLKQEQQPVSYLHLRHVFPFPKELGTVLSEYDHILVPELNAGQLSKLISQEYALKVESLNKIKGIPFTAQEIYKAVKNLLD